MAVAPESIEESSRAGTAAGHTNLHAAARAPRTADTTKRTFFTQPNRLWKNVFFLLLGSPVSSIETKSHSLAFIALAQSLTVSERRWISSMSEMISVEGWRMMLLLVLENLLDMRTPRLLWASIMLFDSPRVAVEFSSKSTMQEQTSLSSSERSCERDLLPDDQSFAQF